MNADLVNPFAIRVRDKEVPMMAVGGVPIPKPAPRVPCPGLGCGEAYDKPLELLAHLPVCKWRAAA